MIHDCHLDTVLYQWRWVLKRVSCICTDKMLWNCRIPLKVLPSPALTIHDSHRVYMLGCSQPDFSILQLRRLASASLAQVDVTCNVLKPCLTVCLAAAAPPAALRPRRRLPALTYPRRCRSRPTAPRWLRPRCWLREPLLRWALGWGWGRCPASVRWIWIAWPVWWAWPPWRWRQAIRRAPRSPCRWGRHRRWRQRRRPCRRLCPQGEWLKRQITPLDPRKSYQPLPLWKSQMMRGSWAWMRWWKRWVKRWTRPGVWLPSATVQPRGSHTSVADPRQTAWLPMTTERDPTVGGRAKVTLAMSLGLEDGNGFLDFSRACVGVKIRSPQNWGRFQPDHVSSHFGGTWIWPIRISKRDVSRCFF